VVSQALNVSPIVVMMERFTSANAPLLKLITSLRLRYRRSRSCRMRPEFRGYWAIYVAATTAPPTLTKARPSASRSAIRNSRIRAIDFGIAASMLRGI
jgi:hypothetical protein